MLEAINPNVARETINPNVAPACLMCDGQRHRSIFNEFGLDVLQCRDCGHIFSSVPTDPHYDGYWGEEVPQSDHFYWKTARADMYADFFEKFVAGRSGRLLDMGCGLGFFLSALKHHPAWVGYGCEISPAAVRYACETLGLERILCGPLEEVDLRPESFDLITMWDVIDHIPRPDPILGRCRTLLKNDGIFFIRTPNITVQLARARLNKLLRGSRPGVNYLQAHHHAHHYSMASIRRLLARNGFPHVEFVHVRPVQGAAAVKGGLRRQVKNASFAAVSALATATRGRVNLDNLFVVARKEARPSTT
jgi:2-polyprenyl-3-methyl-5-hydroxy-6-metoxy-1,4-benzoquinol methylase